MKPRTRLILKIAGWTAATLSLVCAAGGIFGAVKYGQYEQRAAQYDLSKLGDVAERSAVYDAQGDLYSYFGGENRLVVPLGKVSSHFIDALLAREDRRFWQHHGVDVRGILRALLANRRAGHTAQGASTLTQQLARNACGLGERSLDRKILEAVLARRIEKQYSKQQILELYVNRIYFGSGCYGVEAAARSYFGKPAAEGEPEKPTDYLQAAVVLIDNRTGAIRAAVGSRDFAQSKYQRALAARRQIGSTFKPFVYATAFDRGLLPGTLIDDAKIVVGEYKDLPKKWSPENSDGEYGGLQPAANGLLKSRNTMSVRVGEYAGLEKVREVGRTAGLSDAIPDLPVVFLGGFESTVRDVTAAYTIFPNRGLYRAPYLIAKVEDSSGRVLWKAPGTEKRVISAESAWMISGILEQVMKTGTASKAGALGWKKPGAGKTGTTNKFFDAWFVGYTNSLTCGVWVGLDQPETIMEKGYGAALALPIWVDVMKQVAEKDYPTGPLTAGLASKSVTLCSVSGERATSACIAQHNAYDVTLPASRIPASTCRTHPEATPVVAAVPAPSPQAPTLPASTTPLPDSKTATASPPRTAVIPMQRVAPPPAAQAPTAAPLPSIQTPEQRARAERFAAEALQPATPAPVRRAIPVRESTRGLDSLPSLPPTAAPRTTVPDPEGTETSAPPTARMTVRRAVPVNPPAAAPSQEAPAAPAANKSAQLPDGVSERTIVEHLPDGRTRTTTIRSVRNPSKKENAEPRAAE